MLDKLGGCYAPRPSSGPHKLRECLPLALFLRNRLKYALSYTEVKKILAQRLVKVDGRVRTDHTYPAGFMDVIEMEKSGENFRLIYDVKGRYKVHRISKEEAAYKLCIVKKVSVGPKGIPYLTTSDGRIIRHRERHPGSFDIVHVKDAAGHSFATRLNYIFTIGKGAKPWVSLPEGKGIRMTVAEERDKRLAAKS